MSCVITTVTRGNCFPYFFGTRELQSKLYLAVLCLSPLFFTLFVGISVLGGIFIYENKAILKIFDKLEMESTRYLAQSFYTPFHENFSAAFVALRQILSREDKDASRRVFPRCRFF